MSATRAAVGSVVSTFVAALRAAQGDRGVTGGAKFDPNHPSRKHDLPGLVPSYEWVKAAGPVVGQPLRRERRAATRAARKAERG